MEINININTPEANCHKAHHHSHIESDKQKLPLDDVAQELMEGEEFREYVLKNGYHFTNEMATIASNYMKSRHANVHPWSWREVEQAIAPMIQGISNTHKFTNGDYTYIANMAKCDFYPNVITSEQNCLAYAVAMSEDVDGAEGAPFLRWVSDLIAKGIRNFADL